MMIDQMIIKLMNVMSSAAEPVSFAIFESGWISSPCLSIAASIAELMSSSARTEKTVAMRRARWVVSCVMKQDAMRKRGAARTSPLKEGSFFQAAFRPSNE